MTVAVPLVSCAASCKRTVSRTKNSRKLPLARERLGRVLAELHVPATFFLIGNDAAEFPALERRIKLAGDEIANHTQTHPSNFDALSDSQVKSELDRGAATLERFARDPAIRTMMRPPHGRFTEATVKTSGSERSSESPSTYGRPSPGTSTSRASIPISVSRVARSRQTATTRSRPSQRTLRHSKCSLRHEEPPSPLAWKAFSPKR